MNWFAKLKAGLGKSSERLGDGIGNLFTARRKLDQATLDELEECLITADLGVATSAKLISALKSSRFEKEISEAEILEILAAEAAAILEPVAKALVIDTGRKPEIILVCGVNGSGKTTTIGKLANGFIRDGKRVMLAAGDTFRAAAIEQLQVWGERTGAPVVASTLGADAAGLVFEAVEKARAEGVDVLLIDTAGRLQNKTDLMAELEKVVRVIKKLDESAPHQTLLVLDATIGQNAHAQVETFAAMVNVSGLVVTKLDGTAKGGVLVALADKFRLPVHAIGVGEGIDDLQPFTADAYARNLLGIEDAAG